MLLQYLRGILRGIDRYNATGVQQFDCRILRIAPTEIKIGCVAGLFELVVVAAVLVVEHRAAGISPALISDRL